MRSVPSAMTDAWLSPDKTGPRRPCVRATIQKFSPRQHRYDTSDQTGENLGQKQHIRGYVTSALFGDRGNFRELSNIRKCSWSRSVQQDVAECTITLSNSELQAIGTAPHAGQDDDFDNLGALTPTRGDALTADNRWGFVGDTGWQGMIMPDRLVKTYEGYGMDPSVYPALDTHLKQSGTWLIDDCEYSASGDIEVKMRDLGRLLLDYIVFPPAVPYGVYPLSFTRQYDATFYYAGLSGGNYTLPAGTRVSSSNQYWLGQGVQRSDGGNVIEADGTVMGHHETHALTQGDGSYWMSTGQNSVDDLVWIQFDFPSPVNIGAIGMVPAFGPYRVYWSMKDKNGRWMGKRKLPKTKVAPNGGYGVIDHHSDIPYYRTWIIGGDYMSDGGIYGDNGYIPASVAGQSLGLGIHMPKSGHSTGVVAKSVRITFGRLQPFPVDQLHPWAAALEGFTVYAGPKKTLRVQKTPETYKLGNYADWTDVVRWMLAWGGWFWPEPETGENFMPISPDQDATYAYQQADPVIPRGALWADLMDSGTGGVADLTVDMFDKKPFFDIIAEVRDTLGFNAYTDETGGFIFRMPNVWRLGNYLAPDDLDSRGQRTRTDDYVTIDENQTLKDYKVTTSSRNIREFVFVGDTTSKVGWATRGYWPDGSSGLRRVAGWTDQNLTSETEARVGADLIATRQMFGYRTGVAVIPGNPAIQIDDQVKLYEKTTNEMFFHYIEGISSELDMIAGTWDYTMQTHWLGKDANVDGEWVVRGDKLDDLTKAYLNEMGAI